MRRQENKLVSRNSGMPFSSAVASQKQRDFFFARCEGARKSMKALIPGRAKILSCSKAAATVCR